MRRLSIRGGARGPALLLTVCAGLIGGCAGSAYGMRQVLALALTSILACVGCAASTPPPAPPSAPTGVASASAASRASSSPGMSTNPVGTSRPTPTLAPGVTRMVDLTSRPSGILAAGDAIWAEDHAQTDRVYAIDPETGKALAAINVTRPCDLAATPGLVWVADLEGDRLIRIDVTTRKADGEVPGVRGPCGPQVSAGAIWLAVDDGLARVDPKTGKVVTTKLGGSAFPGAGTPLWAATYESGDLLRVDTKSGAIKRTVSPPGDAVDGPPIAVGFDALWFGNGSSRRVYRLDPVTGAVRAEIATSSPGRLLVTADSVWLTSYDEGVVERIDPATNAVVYRARLGGNINGITEGFGGVWVSDTGRGRLYRLDPAATGVEP